MFICDITSSVTFPATEDAYSVSVTITTLISSVAEDAATALGTAVSNSSTSAW